METIGSSSSSGESEDHCGPESMPMNSASAKPSRRSIIHVTCRPWSAARGIHQPATSVLVMELIQSMQEVSVSCCDVLSSGSLSIADIADVCCLRS